MKKSIVAVLMVLGMVSIVQAEVQSATGTAYDRSQACSEAKSLAQNYVSYGMQIVWFGKCDCSVDSRGVWTCNVDYRIEKK